MCQYLSSFSLFINIQQKRESPDQFIFHLNVTVQNLVKIRSRIAEICYVRSTRWCTDYSVQLLFAVLGIALRKPNVVCLIWYYFGTQHLLVMASNVIFVSRI